MNGILESRREQRQFEREFIKKDRDDLRDLLDDANMKLYTRVLGQITLERVYSDPFVMPEPDLRTEAGEQMKELFQMASRLFIRLGREHPVTETFADCVRTVEQALDRADAAAREGQEPLKELAVGRAERVLSYWAVYHRYTDSVLQLVGARLDVRGAHPR